MEMFGIMDPYKTEMNKTNTAPQTIEEKKEMRLKRNRVAAELSRKRRREKLNIMEIYAQRMCLVNAELKNRAFELLQMKLSMGI